MAFEMNLYACAFWGLLAVFIARWLQACISAYKFSKAHGCKPAHQIPQWERIIGYSMYRQQVNAVNEKRLLETSRRRYEENGTTWSASIMGQTMFGTIDPDNVKAILATNFKDFGLGARLESFGSLLGRGIFTSDGEAWVHSRNLVRPNFTRTQVADLGTFETHIRHMISKIPRDGTTTVDLQTLFFQLTLDSATEFLFGESVNCLTSPEGSEQQLFGIAFDYAQAKLGNRSRMGKLKWLMGQDDEFTSACKRVHNFVDQIVYKALDRIQPEDVEKSIGDARSGRYVFLDEMVKSTRNPQQLRDELLNILLAGRDTTASLLSHTFFVLARRPDIFEKLLAEIDALNGKAPDYETIKGMTYLRYLLTESLRLYPVVPGNARFANKDTTLPTGGGPDGKSPIHIKKGNVVVYSPWSMHRRKDVYGEDALEFRPERWAAEKGLRPGWAYLPFNGGPRICVGQQFALTEASYTIVRLLQEFNAIAPRDDKPWTEQLSLTLAPSGVKVVLTPRA